MFARVLYMCAYASSLVLIVANWICFLPLRLLKCGLHLETLVCLVSRAHRLYCTLFPNAECACKMGGRVAFCTQFNQEYKCMFQRVFPSRSCLRSFGKVDQKNRRIAYVRSYVWRFRSLLVSRRFASAQSCNSLFVRQFE